MKTNYPNLLGAHFFTTDGRVRLQSELLIILEIKRKEKKSKKKQMGDRVIK